MVNKMTFSDEEIDEMATRGDIRYFLEENMERREEKQMSFVAKMSSTGLLLVLSIGTGFWLSSYGKPFNSALFNIHKLIALATAIYTAILVRNLLKGIDTSALIQIMVIALGLSLIILFGSGILLSLGKAPYNLIKTVHTITTFSTLLATVITFYLLLISRR